MKDKAYAALTLIIAVVVLGGLLTGVVALWNSYYGEDQHTACKVTDKDRTKDSDGKSDARVYTENCGTFRVADTMVKGKFRSGDTFGSIQKDHTYNFTTIGWRVGFTSSFPNIIEAVEVK